MSSRGTRQVQPLPQRNCSTQRVSMISLVDRQTTSPFSPWTRSCHLTTLPWSTNPVAHYLPTSHPRRCVPVVCQATYMNTYIYIYIYICVYMFTYTSVCTLIHTSHIFTRSCDLEAYEVLNSDPGHAVLVLTSTRDNSSVSSIGTTWWFAD